VPGGRLLDFLRDHPADHTFLIGDIVDFWAMSRSINWSQAQNTVVQKLLRRARHGERVVFIPGNHDEVLRDYCGIVFGEVEVVDELVHETADGRRFLLIHGDQFDQVTRHHRWVAVLGDKAYELLVRINTLLSWGRRKLGWPATGRWPATPSARSRQRSISFSISKNRPFITPERGLDGVICGHIHWATIREIGGLTLRELRRLGRFLHGHRRALRRPPGTGDLGRSAAAKNAGCARPGDRARRRNCGGVKCAY
jgi:UDP-2,3-diacylglucosamine pyrophosphatase LpxH